MAYSGFEGKVYTGAVDMDVTEWSADIEITEIDITTTADAGFENTLEGPTKISGKFTVFYTATKNPFDAAQSLAPGDTPTLTLHTGGGDTLSGLALITKVMIKSAVKEAVSIEVNFRNKGVWVLPGQ
jgi:hypothetical protein